MDVKRRRRRHGAKATPAHPDTAASPRAVPARGKIGPDGATGAVALPGHVVQAGEGGSAIFVSEGMSAVEQLTAGEAIAGATGPELASGHHRIVASAAIITLGNLLSSILGMIRIQTINALFYVGITGGAFVTALRPVQQVSDLLVGGSVSGALIPTFVDYSRPDQRDELRHVYCTVANLVAIMMTVATVGLILAAPYFVPLETSTSGHEGQLQVQLVQIAALSLLGLGLYFSGSALLYAMKEVVYPAFATGIYHVGIILCGTLLLLYAVHHAGLPLDALLRHDSTNPALNVAREIGARGLAAGAAIGALGEFLLLLPALRRIVRVWQPVLDLRHPAVRQILRLYAPVVLSLVFSVAAQNLDIALMLRTPGGRYANALSFANTVTLIQFPVGLVAVALSLSVLPSLAAAANANDMSGYKRTLGLGFRLGLLLMIPAMTALLVLARPIMALLFQHGTCGAACTYRNVLALRSNSVQLPFLALDQLLIAAYYARKNTVVPMLVGIASIAVYAVVAIPFAQSIGLPAISFANAMQNTSHAIILFVLLTLSVGNLGARELASGVARIGVAAAGMAGACWGLLALLPRLNPVLFSLDHLAGQLLVVTLVGGVGAVVYLALASVLKVREMQLLGDMVRRKLGRPR